MAAFWDCAIHFKARTKFIAVFLVQYIKVRLVQIPDPQMFEMSKRLFSNITFQAKGPDSVYIFFMSGSRIK